MNCLALLFWLLLLVLKQYSTDDKNFLNRFAAAGNPLLSLSKSALKLLQMSGFYLNYQIYSDFVKVELVCFNVSILHILIFFSHYFITLLALFIYKLCNNVIVLKM